MRLILVVMYEVTEPELYRDPKRPKLTDLGGDEVQGQQRPSPKGPSTPIPPLNSLAYVLPIGPTLIICPAIALPRLIERSEHHDEGDGDPLYVTSSFDLCAPYSSKYAVIVRRNRRKESRLSYNLHRHYCHY